MIPLAFGLLLVAYASYEAWRYFLSAAPSLSSNGGRANRTCCSNGHESNQTAQPHNAGKRDTHCTTFPPHPVSNALGAEKTIMEERGNHFGAVIEGGVASDRPRIGSALPSDLSRTNSISANVGRGRI